MEDKREWIKFQAEMEAAQAESAGQQKEQSALGDQYLQEEVEVSVEWTMEKKTDP